MIGAALLPPGALSAPDLARRGQHALDLLAGRPTGPDVISLRRDDGRQIDLEYRAVPLELQGASVALAIARDVTARRQAEDSHRRLEEQLRQATKMEAVGRLAGGVAHDFNNVLTVITSYSEALLHDARPESSTHADLIEIQKAAKRAAGLTAQLLAFSRKQVIEPVVIDLHALLGGAIRMLRRLIGENIQLRFAPGGDIGAIRVDPNQVEQVLINLAVNARDAMPTGGVLTVATANTLVDAEFASAHGGAAAGEYVQLSISDTGAGMPTEVLAHLFEPFFTTKPVGHGTGLGLSMVYGIVQQSGGFLRVRSTVDGGTTFDVFFPRHGEAAPGAGRARALGPAARRRARADRRGRAGDPRHGRPGAARPRLRGRHRERRRRGARPRRRRPSPGAAGRRRGARHAERPRGVRAPARAAR